MSPLVYCTTRFNKIQWFSKILFIAFCVLLVFINILYFFGLVFVCFTISSVICYNLLMKKRFFNAFVMTMNGSDDTFFGEVHTDNNKITYVGSQQTDKVFDEEIDLCGNIIMPGFKDCHCHSPMSLFRNNADDLPLDVWLNQKIFPLEAKLTGDDVYWGTMLSVAEYVSAGITAVCDMYFFDEWLIKAMADAGMRCVFVKGTNDLGKKTQDVLEECEANYKKLNGGSPLIRYELGVHAEYTASEDFIIGTAKLAKKLNSPVSVHLSESKKEVDDCIKRYGKSPAFVLAERGLFDNGGMAYHCVYLSDEEMQLLAKKGVTVVTNPASNLKLANGIAPLCKMADCGLNIAIGTDGPASNNSLDMFREMYLACTLQKANSGDPSVMPAEAVLKMATVNGAKAMRLDDCDCIAEGKQADFVVIDLNRPNMQPIANLKKALVYSADKSNVKMTVVAGKILYRDGKFNIGVPVEEIYERCKKITQRLINE